MAGTAIIGAGMAGLACAERLAAAGVAVTMFDKGRGPGGRVSSRRVDSPAGTLRFDHGAQYFTVRDPDFAARVARWRAEGLVAAWPAAGADALVGVPAMNAPIKDMAARHTVHWDARIDAIAACLSGGRRVWSLDGPPQAAGQTYDRVIVALPAEQAATLLAPVVPDFASLAVEAVSTPCWTLMAAFATPVASVADVLRSDGVIAWAARDSAKPGRAVPPGLETWVVQAGGNWSRMHLEDTADVVVPHLLDAFASRLGADLPPAIFAAAHRWRYARVDRPIRIGALWQPETGIGVCGDWLIGPRIECAYLSGRTLAEILLR